MDVIISLELQLIFMLFKISMPALVVVIAWINNYLCNQCLSPLKL